jgi:hypothetical protein
MKKRRAATRRTAALCAAGLAALMLAGVAGGVVRYVVFPIAAGQSATRAGSLIVCEHQTNAGRPAFVCGVSPRAGTNAQGYGFVISAWGVSVQRFAGGSGSGLLVRSYPNLGLAVGAAQTKAQAVRAP